MVRVSTRMLRSAVEAKLWIGADVGGDCAHHVADLVVVVVGQRKPLEMVIKPPTKIARDILRNTFGEVIVDVTRDRADGSDCDRRERGHARKGQSVFARGEVAQPGQEVRQLVLPDDVIEDDLERPGRGDAHRRLNQHRDEDHDQPFAVRLDDFENEPEHAFRRRPLERGWHDLFVGDWCFTH